MKYRCKKCGELYDTLPEECDFDSEGEFEETEMCENCGEYKILYEGCCIDCIKEQFNEKIGMGYIEQLDKKREEWGLEPFFMKEFLYLGKNERENSDFLWEYCIRDAEGLSGYIFKTAGKQGD